MTDPYRGERIAKLPDHPAWQDLEAEVAAQEDVYYDRLAKRLRVGPVDETEIAERRAYYRGMRAVVGMPAAGAKAIEKELAKGKGEGP